MIQFLPASEALDRALGGLVDDKDYRTEAVLLLSRLQLDQMTEILTRLLGADAASRPGVEIENELASRLAARDVSDLAYEVASVCEGLELRRALGGCLAVVHGFAVDGSVSLTVGPRYPSLAALELQGSEDSGGELNDEPNAIFERAQWCTAAAATIYAALSHSCG